ncbi:MAG TPA: DUF362 domain-containing protein [Longimicrobium sp.]|nr:DUF362 domain-containing protein [Longimicrobium sp.]
MSDSLDPRRVVCARVHGGYDGAADGVASLLRVAGLDAARAGTPEWNPLGEVIPRGGRVLIKPNWVTHHNHSGAGTESLVTHPAVIEAVARFALRAAPATLVIGDAPVQGCDFDVLRRDGGVDAMMERLRPEAEAMGARLELADFRRVVLAGAAIENRTREIRRDDSDYVLFDVAGDSDLEPITDDGGRFRVTMYDPDALRRTHAPGKHQYLIAREAIDADVVLNLPKLKTHKKACVTGALKNLVGINGHKEYLPHHRKGGAAAGGDCYPGRPPAKALVEELLDTANRTTSSRLRWLLPRISWVALRLEELRGGDRNIEGSWHGNDTVWRMCLDLQRVLRYGRADGTLADTPRRTVLTITDAVVAGEGEGPLAPTPVGLGMLTMGSSTAATEWANALLMGFDPRRIPLIANSFARHRYPLAGFAPEAVVVASESGVEPVAEFAAREGRAFRPPAGWVGHCELEPRAVGAAC